MAFTWKDKEDMWKGEGIYFLTFTVKNRARLLGTLRRLPTYTTPLAATTTAAAATTAATTAAAPLHPRPSGPSLPPYRTSCNLHLQKIPQYPTFSKKTRPFSCTVRNSAVPLHSQFGNNTAARQ